MTGRPRSVVHVVRSDSFAGVERYVCDVATELSARGWSVSVVGGEPALMRAALPPAVPHLPADTTVAVWGALRSLGGVAVVHAHMTAAELAAVASRPWHGGAVVSTRHFAQQRGRRRVVRVAGLAVARGISVELAISRFVAEHVEGSPRVLLNGVPDDPSQPDVEGNRTVLVAQRLQPEKDTETALRAFAASGLAQDGWRMSVAGRGVLEPQLRTLVRELGLLGSVELVGFVTRPALLRDRAAMFLATAPAEPFGLSLVEAMAAGLPVLAAAGGAHTEVLQGQGVLFPPGDVQACADALRRVADSTAERRRLGEAARCRQREHLSLPRHVEALERVYEEVSAGAIGID